MELKWFSTTVNLYGCKKNASDHINCFHCAAVRLRLTSVDVIDFLLAAQWHIVANWVDSILYFFLTAADLHTETAWIACVFKGNLYDQEMTLLGGSSIQNIFKKNPVTTYKTK